MKLALCAYGLSDQGQVRSRNEDCFFVDPGQGLFLVADGMGGRRGGDLASAAVAGTLPALIARAIGHAPEQALDSSSDVVRRSLVELSNYLRSEAHGKAGLDGMGSTLVMLLVCGDQAIIAHLGDSRAYLFRGGHLERLTSDHTIVQILVDAGEVDPGEAANHPARGQLTRFIGMEGEPLPEVRVLPLVADDRVLLCSDGLTNMVSDEEIARLLGRGDSADRVCQRAIEAANHAGGTDNISVVVVDVKVVLESADRSHCPDPERGMTCASAIQPVESHPR